MGLFYSFGDGGVQGGREGVELSKGVSVMMIMMMMMKGSRWASFTPLVMAAFREGGRVSR